MFCILMVDNVRNQNMGSAILAFNFGKLNERIHDHFFEMDKQAQASPVSLTEPLNIYLMDALTVHSAVPATVNGYRTFIRISYDVKEFDRLGNSLNPLYLGTSLGVYYRDDSMTQWEAFDTNLPNVSVTDLEINLEEGKIVAATSALGQCR